MQVRDDVAAKYRILIQHSFKAYEMSLAEGLRFERRIFHGLFGTQDQKEGMSMFTLMIVGTP